MFIDHFDAATAVLALIKEAEVRQDQFQHRQGLDCWAYFSWVLKKHPVLSQVIDDINEIIVDRFTRISYPDGYGRYQPLSESAVRSVLFQYGKT